MYNLLNVPDIPLKDDDIKNLLNAGQISDGEQVRELEVELAKQLDAENVILVNSDSSAIFLCLKVSGIGAGDVVIISPMVCLAVSMPVLQTGATVRWCDVDSTTGIMDVACLSEIDLKNVKAVIVSHWCGNVAEISQIKQFTDLNGLVLIQDATEAMGSYYEGQPLNNSFSDFVVYSLGPVKHITSIEGGIILSKSVNHKNKINQLKKFGLNRQSFRDADGEIDALSDVTLVGGNYAFNNVFAYIASTQITGFTALRKGYIKSAVRIRKILDKYPFITPSGTANKSEVCPWVMSVVVSNQLKLLRYLKANGIMVSKLHLKNYVYSCFGDANKVTPLKGVEQFQDTVLCLPCRANLPDEYYDELDRLLGIFTEE